MKISVIGTGYVGLVTGACFADMGNDVWCVDVDCEKIDALKKGVIPIYEPGLEELVRSNYRKKRLNFMTDIKEAICHTQICFIAVGTPMGEDGGADLQYVLSVAKSIGECMQQHMYIVDKSTVPVGTARKVAKEIQSQLDKRGSDLTFDVISNPEFLKEGTAVADCTRPDRIVIGVDNEEAEHIMKELYLPYVRNTENFIIMDVASAEMTKYAANALLATKISFINEIANICERVGADVNKVRKGIGSDSRIGYSFIYPGCGYGGSCFPKDVQALINTCEQNGYHARILESVQEVNEDQKKVLVNKIIENYGQNLSDKTYTIWGLAFKPDTDDMRQAPAITIIRELAKRGAKLQVYDPKAMEEAKQHYLKDIPGITYFDSKYEAVKGADALILVTEWKEFRSPDFWELKKLLKQPVLYDGRNQFSKNTMKKYGFEYYQIGVSGK